MTTFRLQFALLLATLILAAPAVGQEMEEHRDVAYGPDELQKLDIYKPLKAQGKLPAVIWVHGGGWAHEDKRNGSNGIRDLAPALVERGFVAISCNYRLAPTHRHPAQIDDVQRVVRWVRANADKYGIDPDRIGAAGVSAGAHLAAMLAVRETREKQGDELDAYSSRVRAAAAINGPMDLRDGSPELSSPVITGALGNYLSADPAQAGKDREDASPILFVDKHSAPVLFLVGSRDTWVPLAHSQRMAEAMEAHKVEAEVFTAEGVGHELLPSTHPAAMRRMLDWFEENLDRSKGSGG